MFSWLSWSLNLYFPRVWDSLLLSECFSLIFVCVLIKMTIIVKANCHWQAKASVCRVKKPPKTVLVDFPAWDTRNVKVCKCRAGLFHVAVWKCVCPVCLSITSVQFPGQCFWCICRFKPILLALFGNPWIRIICPQLIGRRFFFLQHLVIKTWKSCSVFPPNLQHSNVTKCVKCQQAQEEAEDFFPTNHPTFLIFFPTSVRVSSIFSCSCCLCPPTYLCQ